MKKMIIMIGLLMSFGAFAGDIVRMPMQDFAPTGGMDFVFEIKTTKFDNVVLDCQSFITGMSFADKGELKASVYLDMFMCEELVQYLSDSKRNNLPVCIGVDAEYNELYITREEGDECN